MGSDGSCDPPPAIFQFSKNKMRCGPTRNRARNGPRAFCSVTVHLYRYIEIPQEESLMILTECPEQGGPAATREPPDCQGLPFRNRSGVRGPLSGEKAPTQFVSSNAFLSRSPIQDAPVPTTDKQPVTWQRTE